MEELDMDKAILYIATLWPRFEVNNFTAPIWFKHFGDLSIDEFIEMMDEFARTVEHPHPPQIPEVHALWRARRARQRREREIIGQGRKKLEEPRTGIISPENRALLDGLYEQLGIKN